MPEGFNVLLEGVGVDCTLSDDMTLILHHGDPLVVHVEQRQVEVDIDEFDADAELLCDRGQRNERLVAQRTPLSGEEADLGTAEHQAVGSIFRVMRPVTAIVVAILLAFIVVAFVIKLLNGGLSP